MSEYTSYPRTVVETSPVGNGWGPLLSAGVGGVIGYFLGRNNGPCGGGAWGGYGWNGGACGTAGCQTCFQQGEYTGESRAADNYIAQKVNGLENMLVAMNNDMKDQRINDLVAKNQLLETRQLILETSMPLSCQVGQVNRTLDSVTTGCGFKSYPGCGFKSYPGCNNGCGGF